MNKKVRVITMLTKIETNMKVFAENFKAAKKAFVLNSSMEASACAAAFIGEEQPVTADELKDAKHLLSKNTYCSPRSDTEMPDRSYPRFSLKIRIRILP